MVTQRLEEVLAKEDLFANATSVAARKEILAKENLFATSVAARRHEVFLHTQSQSQSLRVQSTQKQEVDMVSILGIILVALGKNSVFGYSDP